MQIAILRPYRFFVFLLLPLGLPLHSWGQLSPYSAGIRLGYSAYWGDLEPTATAGWAHPDGLIGLHAAYRLSTAWRLNLNTNIGILHADDYNYPEDFALQRRALAFRTTYNDLTFQLGWMPNADGRWGPYLRTGVGLAWLMARPNFVRTKATELAELIAADQSVKTNRVTAILPVEGGLWYRPWERWSIEAGVRFVATATDYLDGISQSVQPYINDRYMNAYIGASYTFGSSDPDEDGVAGRRDRCPNVPGLAVFGGCPDTDGDGLPDLEDDCPFTAGLRGLQGCPDTDGDGLTDAADLCPDTYGPIERQGCPIIDTDKDGIEDEFDACPDLAGPPERQGCPAIDSDRDGILDEDDRCPDEFGLIIFMGCPDADNDGIEDAKDACPYLFGVYAADGCPLVVSPAEEARQISTQYLTFPPDGNEIKHYSLLLKIAQFLQDNPTYRLRISGHADPAAGDGAEHPLSTQRARAAYDYLRGQGVAARRITYEGVGARYPLSDNSTVIGQSQNRRVEFSLRVEQ